MMKLCEVAETLDDMGLVREADEVIRVMERVAQMPPPAQGPDYASLIAQKDALIGQLNAQKLSLQPSPQMMQDPQANATQIASNNRAMADIDRQLQVAFAEKNQLVMQQSQQARRISQQVTNQAQRPMVN